MAEICKNKLTKWVQQRMQEIDKLKYRVIELARIYMFLAIADHKYMKSIMFDNFTMTPKGFCKHLVLNYLPAEVIDAFMDIIHPYLPKLLAKIVTTNHPTNLGFLGNVATKRDWMGECIICFEPLTCEKCQYHHAIVSKPCGHVMCVACSAGITKCPECRVEITSKFSSHKDIELPDGCYRKIYDQFPNIMWTYWKFMDKIDKQNVDISLKDAINSALSVEFKQTSFQCEHK